MSLKTIEMTEKSEHNLVVQEGSRLISLRSTDLPKVITLELEDGSKKRYTLSYAPKAEGLILNKAI
jgi:hypothetical protein